MGGKQGVSEVIVHSLEPVTLVGAGILGKSDLDLCKAYAPTIVAADGGASHCLQYGIIPQAVIGDLDSLDEKTRSILPPLSIHHISEQNSTDFDKALRHIEAPVILGVGFSGGRMDHQLACYNGLVQRPERRCILVSDTDIAFLSPRFLELDLAPGTRVSLFPMGLVEGSSDGLLWPIAGLSFTPDGRIGTSNSAVGPVSLAFTAPKMLVILPRACLDVAVRELAAQSGSWTAL